MEINELIKKEALRRGLSPRTIKTYQQCVGRFFHFTSKEPIAITKYEIKDFLDHLIEKKSPGNTINVYLNALKFFYENVLHRRLTINIKYSKIPKILPEFLSKEETALLLEKIYNQKHQLMIKLLYSTGMRVSELVSLRIRDFEFNQNYGWVRRGKGNKDRLFIIAKKLKQELLEWVSSQKLNSNDWLFPGNNHLHYSTESIRIIIKRAAKEAKINKNVHPHTLRHSFATHLVENGYAITDVQPLLGHSRLETTMLYTHLAAPKLLKVESPFDQLEE